MTYSESARGITISQERAVGELHRHGCGPDDVQLFFIEMGEADTYKASDVLAWLGY